MHCGCSLPDIPRYDLFGVAVSATTYDQLVPLLIARAQARIPTTVEHMAVHGLMLAASRPVFRECLNALDVVAPDGQPVRWALNCLYRTRLPDRVYGPELMLRLCQAAQQHRVGVYLYGGTPEGLRLLRSSLRRGFPALEICGWESPPFRDLDAQEEADAVRRINESGAGLVFLGIGTPKQELFAFRHRRTIRAVQLCVGAAFDFHAGLKPMAPSWMQRCGLEWLFRLATEPRRLWRRYLVTNTLFSLRLTRLLVLGW